MLWLFSAEECGFAALVRTEHHIVNNVHIADKTHTESVLGNE